jgi:hypothetical protein
MEDGEGVGVVETIEDTTADSIEVGVVDTVEDMVVDSIEDGELVDDAIMEETIELSEDDTANEELRAAGCDIEKQDSSYKCAVGICMSSVTWDSGILNR